MIDFSLTGEQAALRSMAHDFPTREIPPVAWDDDHEAPPRRRRARRHDFSVA
jgi:hypothetical protein